MAYGYRFGEFNSKIGKMTDGTFAVKDGITIDLYEWSNLDRRPPMCVTLGCHLTGYKLPFPDLTDTASNIAGVLKRTAYKHPDADPVLRAKLKKFAQRWCKKNLSPLPADLDVSFKAWIESTRYSRRRKDELIRCWAAFCEPFSKKDESCKSFSKAESYEAYKHLRGINSRSDEFKCAVGPVFSAIEKVLFKMKWFIKKIPVNDRARAVMERLWTPSASYYATDYSAFESHFDEVLMSEVEFVLYEYMVSELEVGNHWFELIKRVIGARNTCVYKGFTASGIQSRMSGEMCTSLGNSFANLMIFLFVCSEAGIDESEIDGFVEGDDGIFRFERHQSIDDDLFRRLGLTIKIQKFEHLWEASFCGLVFDPVSLAIVTDPRVVLADFGWAGPAYVKCNRNRLLELLRAKSMSFAYQYPGCPIVQSLAQYGMRLTCHVSLNKLLEGKWLNSYEKEQLLDAMENREQIMVREVTQSSRELVESSFSIPIADQLRIEALLDAQVDLRPIDLGFLSYMPQEWRDYWTSYVMPTQGDYPVALSSDVIYDNIGELVVENKRIAHKVNLRNLDQKVDVTTRLRARWQRK